MVGPGLRFRALSGARRSGLFPCSGPVGKGTSLTPSGSPGYPLHSRGLQESPSAFGCPASEDAPKRGCSGREVGRNCRSLSCPQVLSEPVSSACIGADTIPLLPPPPFRTAVSRSSGVNDLSIPARFSGIKAVVFSPSPVLPTCS